MDEIRANNLNPPAPVSKNKGGRPKGAKDKLPRVRGKATFRELYDNEIEKHGPRLVKAIIRAALRGDSRAQVDLVNRVLGKPKETVELSGPGGSPLLLQAAAPVALALMSTEELRALAALQARLGLPDLDVQALPEHRPARDLSQKDEPGQESPEPIDASPLLGALPQPASPQPDTPASAGQPETQNPVTEPQNPASSPTRGALEQNDGEPFRASQRHEAPPARLGAAPDSAPGAAQPLEAEPEQVHVMDNAEQDLSLA